MAKAGELHCQGCFHFFGRLLSSGKTLKECHDENVQRNVKMVQAFFDACKAKKRQDDKFLCQKCGSHHVHKVSNDESL